MSDQSKFQFKAKIWLYSGPTAWYFVTLPKDMADHIKFFYRSGAGFGSVKVKVTIGESEWQTSIFPDKESGSFVLPIKAAIRKAEKITKGDEVELALDIMQSASDIL